MEDLYADLLEYNKSRELLEYNKARDGFRSAMTLTSAPRVGLNGCHKPTPIMPDMLSPLAQLAHRDFLQRPPQNKPVNLSTARIVRPWDAPNNGNSPSGKPATPTSVTTPTSAGMTASEDGSSDEEDEEISVDDDEPPAPPQRSGGQRSGGHGKGKGSGVSPLDALMAMTSKTFEGLEGSGDRGESTIFYRFFFFIFCFTKGV